jgi:hypothetical protein
MPFPAFGTPSTGTAVSNTSHTIVMPASVPVGATILLNIATDNAGTYTMGTQAGTFTRLRREASAGSVVHEIWYKLNADGTEGGVSVSLTLSATGELGNSTSPNSTAITPSWGSADTLFISLLGINTSSGSPTVSAYPTNYTGNNSNITEGSLSGVGVAWATRELAAATDDPGAWTLTAANAWSAQTVAIRPGLISLSWTKLL